MKGLDYFFLTIILWSFTSSLLSQNKYLSGYKKDIAGVNYVYHSPYSYSDNCYLTRANEFVGTMEWETESVPESFNEETVSFIWIYGIDITSQSENFELSVNDEKLLTFSNPTSTDVKTWLIKGEKSVRLSFYQSMIDLHHDQMPLIFVIRPIITQKRLSFDGHAKYHGLSGSINSRPKEQVDRLLQRIKEGRIEVTGMFLNFAEIADERALAFQIQAIKDFKDQGIEVTTAMQNDFNGIAWCMPDLYENTGVKYLTMGVHHHRARLPFNKPISFWWESPSGKRLLAYRSEHYMHGNALSLTAGQIDVFRNNLSKYLSKLEEKEYPFDRIAFQFSGYTTDNSPSSTKACYIIKEWNEKYEWPKLKSALASEFMVYMDQNHPDEIDIKKVAWPDWWTDGFGSAMKETKISRISHAQMLATMGLLPMAQASGAHIPEQINNEVKSCYDNLLLYDEHTFGTAESITDPDSKNSMNQWSQKSSYVWSANQQANLLREKAIGIIQPCVGIPEEPSVTVFNTLNWKRSGVAEAFIDHDILPLGKESIIVDSDGNRIPAQIINSRGEGTYWALWVENVPALGYATYTISVSDKPKFPIETKIQIDGTFENDFYRIMIDEGNNGLTSVFDKELNKELIDQESKYSLWQFCI